MPKYISGGNILLDPIFVLKKAGIVEGMIVADLGCGGVGHFIFPAAHMVGNKGTVYAVDILRSALEAVESKAKIEGLNNIETVWSNLEKYRATRIPNKSLDVALLVNVLFQNMDCETVVKEAARLIKPDGTLLIVDWNESPAPFGPPAEKKMKREDLKKIVKSLKLKEIEEFEAGDYHYGLIFRKD